MISRTIDVTHTMIQHIMVMVNTATRNSWLSSHVSASILASDVATGTADVCIHSHVAFMYC